MGRKPLELSGKRFGKLQVIKLAGQVHRPEHEHGPKIWLCLCDCGKKTRVISGSLSNGNTTSCGCFFREWVKRPRRHGELTEGKRVSPELRAFYNAKARCRRGSPDWPFYGARGIKFRFRSFSEFLACLGRKPTPLHTLDRVNNNGHYEPGNVRWATKCEQAKNRRVKQ